MISRIYLGRTLVFDRDAIVHAALRAYIENILADLDPLKRHQIRVVSGVDWRGDLQTGGFYADDGCGDYHVVAWTTIGVVGLAWELGWGPLEQLGLSVEAITGGPDDVREAVPGMPSVLEPALILATDMLEDGPEHGEKLAGVGFWLDGDRVGGSMFRDAEAAGARWLVAWGALRNGRLPSVCGPEHDAWADEMERGNAGPIHALIDAVTARALQGPTELTADELALLLPTPVDGDHILGAQRCLQKVGVTWPGSPEIPPPPPPGPNPFLPPPGMVFRTHPLNSIGMVGFHRGTIVHAALRAYVEVLFAWLDPLERHSCAPCADPNWTGDLQDGAFYNGDGYGNYDVVGWSEAGVVGLSYQVGFGPLEQLGLSVAAVTGGAEDVRAALPGLPVELESALAMAVSLLDVGSHGEKLAGVGFWLCGDRVAGTLFDTPNAAGVPELALWGSVASGRLRLRTLRARGARLGPESAVIQKLVDAVVARALAGPTVLTTDELATLLPTPPEAAHVLAAQRSLQKVGITWPGSPLIPPEPPRTEV